MKKRWDAKSQVEEKIFYTLFSNSLSNKKMIDTSDPKFMLAVKVGIIFAVLASPWSYDLTSGINIPTKDREGNVTLTGLLIHSVVFVIVLHAALKNDIIKLTSK